MVNITLNGQSYQCASCKEELTTGQYQWIIRNWGIDQPDLSKRNNMGLFCALTNTDFKIGELDNESEQAIYEAIVWTFSESFQYSKDLPKVFVIDDTVLDIPKKVGGCSIGQNIILKQLIDSSRYLEEVISMAVAVYLQPDYSGGKFDYAKAKALEEKISKMPAMVVYPIGFFLLNRVLTTGNRQRPTWPRTKSSLSSSLSRALPKWLRSASYGGMNV